MSEINEINENTIPEMKNKNKIHKILHQNLDIF